MQRAESGYSIPADPMSVGKMDDNTGLTALFYADARQIGAAVLELADDIVAGLSRAWALRTLVGLIEEMQAWIDIAQATHDAMSVGAMMGLRSACVVTRCDIEVGADLGVCAAKLVHDVTVRAYAPFDRSSTEVAA